MPPLTTTLLCLCLACVALLALGVARALGRRARSERRLLAEMEAELAALKRELTDDTRYLRSSRLSQIRGALEALNTRLGAPYGWLGLRQARALARSVRTLLEHLDKIRDDTHRRFFERESRQARHLFYSDSGKPLLTDEQLTAVLTDDDRTLVIAGAGSGKTRVIDFKVRYLTQHKGVPPDRILLLSFSKKSAQDLLERVSRSAPGVEVRTIHSFAYQSIDAPKDWQLSPDTSHYSSQVLTALSEALRDPATFNKLQSFVAKHLYVIKPMIFYESLSDLRADLRKLNSRLVVKPDRYGEIKAERAFRTLRGEYVRSIDERYIADFLHLHDIQYEYESQYPDHPSYRPDFYLPEHDAYLEHFALTASGQPPAWFDNPSRYLQGIEWKRTLHARSNTRLIESYSYQLNTQDTSQYLGDLLARHGIPLLKSLQTDRNIASLSREFVKTLSRFHQSFKAAGATVPELRARFGEPGNQLFLDVFERFLLCHQTVTQATRTIDFHDLLTLASERYRAGVGRSYQYIIVDEFQDTSRLAMRLLDQVHAANPEASLVGIGDDWQSIYGFNGSDVSILLDFATRYPGTATRVLSANFRSHPAIVELGRRFICSNPNQIPKQVSSAASGPGQCTIDFVWLQRMEEVIRALPAKESVFVLYRYQEDCPVLAGVLREFFALDQRRRPIKRPKCRRNLSMMTIHASKGLEADHVFVVFPRGERLGFPSQIEDHFVFNMVRARRDDYPFAEERRLMYVAISRARQSLYLVASGPESGSVFWDELRGLMEPTSITSQAEG